MIVQAAVARQAGRPLVLETLELDEPRADEVLVRLVASGISRADLAALADGMTLPFPFVAGGEGAGLVERVGDAVAGLEPGDAVILTFASCGSCPACATGKPNACAAWADLNVSGRRRDGSTPFVGDGGINGFFHGQSSFATHVLCHHSSAIKVAKGAPLELMACLGGSLQKTAAALVHGFALKPDDAIVITGASAEGLFATMVAAALGVKTIVLADPSEARRTLATDLGATLVVHTDEDLASVVKSLTGVGAGYALDTTGHAAAIEACRASLTPDGTFGLADVEEMDPAAIVAILEEWQADGRLPIERLVSYFPFEHINDALAALTNETVVKPVVRFSIGSFGDLDRAGREGSEIEPPVDEPNDPAIEEPATAAAV